MLKIIAPEIKYDILTTIKKTMVEQEEFKALMNCKAGIKDMEILKRTKANKQETNSQK